MSLFNELKKRNVFRMGAAYLVSIWVIAQIADLVLDSIEAPAWVMKSLLLVFGLGFIISLIVSWAYELTADGLKKERDVVRDESITHITAKRLDYITLAGVVLIVALFAFQQVNSASVNPEISNDIGLANSSPQVNSTNEQVSVETYEQSIAVLPFLALSDNKEDEFFADGLSEELLNVLSKKTNLKVAARTSTFFFKGKNENLEIIGQTLGVAHILEGSVRRSGDKLRITVQLINVDDGFHMWSETYDRNLDDIFAIQDDISKRVVQQLKARLVVVDPLNSYIDETTNPEAQSLFFIAQAKMSERGYANLSSARALFKQVTEIDPNFSRGFIGYAAATYLLMHNHVALVSNENTRAVSSAIETALRLNSDSSEAYAIRAISRSISSGRAYGLDSELTNAVNADFERALELDANNVQALTWYGNFVMTANFDALGALGLYERALSIDPLSRIAMANVATTLVELGRYEKARKHLLNALNYMPGYAGLFSGFSMLEDQSGNLDKAAYWMSIAPGRRTDLLSNIKKIATLSNFDRPAAINFIRTLPNTNHPIAKNVLEFHLKNLLGQPGEVYPLIEPEVKRGIREASAFAFAALIQAGDIEKANEVMSQYASIFFETPVADFQISGVREAVLAAYIVKQLGDKEHAEALLNKTILLTNDLPVKNLRLKIYRAEAFIMLGDDSSAIKALKQAYSAGYRGQLVHDVSLIDEFVIFKPLWGNPEFIALVAKIEKDKIEMRERYHSGQTEIEVQAELTAAGIVLSGYLGN